MDYHNDYEVCTTATATASRTWGLWLGLACLELALLVLLLWALGWLLPRSHAAPRDGCTLAWDATTTHVDGTPAPPGVRYRLWFDAAHGKQAVVELADTDGLALTLDRCEVGDYWVTAYSLADGSDESAPSAAVTLTKAQ